MCREVGCYRVALGVALLAGIVGPMCPAPFALGGLAPAL